MGLPDEIKILEHLKSINIPAFHVVGHISSCQLRFSPRTQKFTGKCDYEGCERTWADFRTNANRTSHVF